LGQLRGAETGVPTFFALFKGVPEKVPRPVVETVEKGHAIRWSIDNRPRGRITAAPPTVGRAHTKADNSKTIKSDKSKNSQQYR
jgi:hypothetical protein